MWWVCKGKIMQNSKKKARYDFFKSLQQVDFSRINYKTVLIVSGNAFNCQKIENYVRIQNMHC